MSGGSQATKAIGWNGTENKTETSRFLCIEYDPAALVNEALPSSRRKLSASTLGGEAESWRCIEVADGRVMQGKRRVEDAMVLGGFRETISMRQLMAL